MLDYKPGVSVSTGTVFSVGESDFLWFGFYTFQTFYLHKMLHNSIKERQKPKKAEFDLFNSVSSSEFS